MQGIAKAAGAKDGWIATDSETAKNVIAEVEKKFGLAIQVIEVQNSDTGLKISGRSHDEGPETRAQRLEHCISVLANCGGNQSGGGRAQSGLATAWVTRRCQVTARHQGPKPVKTQEEAQ